MRKPTKQLVPKHLPVQLGQAPGSIHRQGRWSGLQTAPLRRVMLLLYPDAVTRHVLELRVAVTCPVPVPR